MLASLRRTLVLAVACLLMAALATLGPAAAQAPAPETVPVEVDVLAPDPTHYPFGLAMARDGDLLAVGAPYNSVTPPPKSWGAVYLYRRDGLGWAPLARLDPPEDWAYDFGFTLALDGGVLAVGAPSLFPDVGSQGTVYIYNQNQDNPADWVLTARLKGPQLSEPAFFGMSLDLEGDTLVVETSRYYSCTSEVLVFTRTAGQWQLDGPLALTGARTIALQGETMVVSDNCADNRRGMVAILAPDQQAPGGWSVIQRLQLSVAEAPEPSFFGHIAALDGDTLLVSAPYLEIGTTSSFGAVYIFRRSTTGLWEQEARLTAPDTGPVPRFGERIALEGNVALIGSLKTNPMYGPKAAGASYLFERTVAGQWLLAGRIDPPADDEFGFSHLIDGRSFLLTTNGDGGKVRVHRFFPFPTPAADVVELPKNSAGFTIDVLANDPQPAEGGPLDPASLRLEGPPSRGVATIEGGLIRYRPNLNTEGLDTLMYSVANAVGLRGLARVTISVTLLREPPPADPPPVNPPPVNPPPAERHRIYLPLVRR